jgi:cell division septation protein DedD
MKNKETGEFELLVGNGQIISGFFILALLMAVFFAMGFIVARAKYQQEPGSASALASSPLAESRGPAAAPVTPPAAPLTQAAPDPKAEKPVEPPPQPVPGETVVGAYWQVSATANQDAARALQQTIKDMGLPVTLSQGPNNFTRILVGPYTDTATMARIKTQLENAGLHPVKHIQ